MVLQAIWFSVVVSFVLAQTEKEYVYSQSTGKFALLDKEIGKGYSGSGSGKNAPEKEAEKNIGPIPKGLYTIGQPRVYKKMNNCFDLTPVGHKALARTELMIHGDSKESPGSASKGCIILDPKIRDAIAKSGVTHLRVVK